MSKTVNWSCASWAIGTSSQSYCESSSEYHAPSREGVKTREDQAKTPEIARLWLSMRKKRCVQFNEVFHLAKVLRGFFDACMFGRVIASALALIRHHCFSHMVCLFVQKKIRKRWPNLKFSDHQPLDDPEEQVLPPPWPTLHPL